ncbi:hypothetical protein LAZ67_19002055 [Cordylochernes scorpioides]|uniref:Retrotransposon gag domain-containing protein n=1 Tax=Cordylochernes scorpioides TaxID=51811 RepID=A0ABY6LKE4_9ARAC|nr:hypothetical protein LAZ67_19002055 [Cordylochernes scorpioides]
MKSQKKPFLSLSLKEESYDKDYLKVSKNPQKWIKMFERVAKYNKWDEAQSLANVLFYLKGTAAQWFDDYEDIINSWTQFKTDLCEVFGQKEKLT